MLSCCQGRSIGRRELLLPEESISLGAVDGGTEFISRGSPEEKAAPTA
jgi:hypothetical protein